MNKYIVTTIGAALLAAASAQAKVSQQTLDNLSAAFQGESNTAHRYKPFAKKAQADGYTNRGLRPARATRQSPVRGRRLLQFCRYLSSPKCVALEVVHDWLDNNSITSTHDGDEFNHT